MKDTDRELAPDHRYPPPYDPQAFESSLGPAPALADGGGLPAVWPEDADEILSRVTEDVVQSIGRLCTSKSLSIADRLSSLRGPAPKYEVPNADAELQVLSGSLEKTLDAFRRRRLELQARDAELAARSARTRPAVHQLVWRPPVVHHHKDLLTESVLSRHVNDLQRLVDRNDERARLLERRLCRLRSVQDSRCGL